MQAKRSLDAAPPLTSPCNGRLMHDISALYLHRRRCHSGGRQPVASSCSRTSRARRPAPLWSGAWCRGRDRAPAPGLQGGVAGVKAVAEVPQGAHTPWMSKMIGLEKFVICDV